MTLILAACGPAAEPESETIHNPTMEDFAGNWQLTVVFPEQGDTVQARLGGSANGRDWVMVNPGNQRVRMPTVSLKGDSLVLVSEEFPAVVRPGARAQVRTAGVLRDGVIEGLILATLQVGDSQEVRAGTIRATRAN
jgi:hypothetical protein